MKVLVSKIGGVMYTREALARATASSEMGETEGMIRHLVAAGHRVVYFGRVNGTLPDGVWHIDPVLDGLDEWSDEEDIRANLQPQLDAIRDIGFDAYVVMAGYAGTMCAPWNVKGVQVQACGVRYALPQCLVMHECMLPPIYVNCDPRTYPIHQEMTLMWPRCKPLALLSQRTRSWNRVVGGCAVQCREVYAAPEHWCYRPRLDLVSHKDNAVAIVAHAHMGDGIRNDKQRQAIWPNVLDVAAARELGWRVHGKGWEHYGFYDPEVMTGPISPTAVDELLARSKCGPITSILHGFYTGKMRTYLMQRCLPLLYGRGELGTYDAEFRYVSSALNDSNIRFGSWPELLHLVDYFTADANEAEREDRVQALLDRTEPDFSVLDRCLEAVYERAPETAPDLFFEQFGGYR